MLSLPHLSHKHNLNSIKHSWGWRHINNLVSRHGGHGKPPNIHLSGSKPISLLHCWMPSIQPFHSQLTVIFYYHSLSNKGLALFHSFKLDLYEFQKYSWKQRQYKWLALWSMFISNLIFLIQKIFSKFIEQKLVRKPSSDLGIFFLMRMLLVQ